MNAKEIRQQIYNVLIQAEGEPLSYSRILKKINKNLNNKNLQEIDNSSFSGTISKITNFYPEVKKVSRGLYAIPVKHGNAEDLKTLTINLLTELLSKVDASLLTPEDMIYLNKLIKLKNDLENGNFE